MSKKSKFQIHYDDCNKGWKRVHRKINGKWYWVRMLDLKTCEKCSELGKCNASVQVSVNKRLF